MKTYSKSMFNVFTLCSLLVSLLGSALNVTPAYAAGIVVNSSADNTLSNLDANSTCDLREAITNANDNAATYQDCAAGSGSDTITFSDSLGPITITLASTLPAIYDSDIVSPPHALTINGGGDVTITGSNTYRVFWLSSWSVLTLEGLTVTHGMCTSCNGGGVYSGDSTLTVIDSVFSDNAQGIYMYNGVLIISNSTFSGNSSLYGGAINGSGTTDVTVTNSVFSGNSSPGGAGGSAIYVEDTLDIGNSTFSGNFENSGGRGAVYNGGTGTIVNSTFTNNSVSGTNGVGGLYNQGTLTLTNNTFSGNSNSGSSGAADIYQLGAGSVINLYNTILANSAGGGLCNIEGGTANGKNNLVEDTAPYACGFADGVNGNIIGSSSDPNLGSLTGSPAYFPLNSGSPAIDAGDISNCESADQRGVVRPQDGDNVPGAICDIGSYELDSVAPTVTSSTRVNPSPTALTSVDFTVTFSESVTGVDTGNFTLTTTGVSSAALSGVSGSGSIYTVTVNTGSGNGTIRLDVVDDNTIVDVASNPLGGVGTANGNFNSGETYAIDKTAPTVSSSVHVNPNPTTLASIDFTVTFSESVTGVNTGDFTLTTTGVSGASVSGVSGSGSVYTVTVSTGSGNGTIRLDVLNDGTILDAALNPLGAGFTSGETYIITKVFNLFLPLILR